MNISKIKSYYGFALKSGNLAIGLDSILKANCKVIIIAKTLANNSKNKCLSKTNNSKIVELDQEIMMEITENSKILAVGVTDESLANAIINNLSN